MLSAHSASSESHGALPPCLAGSGFFVLYYGDPLGEGAARIRAARPDLLIVAAGQESRPEVAAYYREAGIRVVEYVAMGYGRNAVDDHVHAAMRSGYDGVFFDEAESAHAPFNAPLASIVRSYGEGKLVVMNTGRAQVDPSIFDVADIVSVENQWDLPLSPAGVHPTRWMAIQGDPAPLAAKSLEEAKARLAHFRANGGHWFYSPPFREVGSTHWVLPPWLEAFAEHVRALAAPGGHCAHDATV